MKDRSVRYSLKWGLPGILIVMILFSGCTQVPFFPNAQPSDDVSLPDSDINVPESVPYENPDEIPPEEFSPEIPPPELSPEPTPTPLVSNISDWDPYTVLPYPQPRLNHTSILKNDTPHTRQVLNTTYSGSLGLAGFAFGKELNITTGPFSITYTVRPNVTSPLDVWAKITVLDPWQNLIAEGGYNRGYPNQETQTMTVYREGRHYLVLEGDFAVLDYTINTGDLAPAQTPTPAAAEEEPPWEEGPF